MRPIDKHIFLVLFCVMSMYCLRDVLNEEKSDFLCFGLITLLLTEDKKQNNSLCFLKCQYYGLEFTSHSLYCAVGSLSLISLIYIACKIYFTLQSSLQYQLQDPEQV